MIGAVGGSRYDISRGERDHQLTDPAGCPSALRTLIQRSDMVPRAVWSSMMNLRRELFRLWIIGAALFVIAVASISYPGIKFEFDAVESKPEVVESKLADFNSSGKAQL